MAAPVDDDSEPCPAPLRLRSQRHPARVTRWSASELAARFVEFVAENARLGIEQINEYLEDGLSRSAPRR